MFSSKNKKETFLNIVNKSTLGHVKVFLSCHTLKNEQSQCHFKSLLWLKLLLFYLQFYQYYCSLDNYTDIKSDICDLHG